VVVWIEDEAYLTAQETCVLLSVKPQTLYAYVSRGLLRSFRQGIQRRRLYLRREVDALRHLRADRGRGASTTAPHAGVPRAEDWIGDR
jgi:citrate synthase